MDSVHPYTTDYNNNIDYNVTPKANGVHGTSLFKDDDMVLNKELDKSSSPSQSTVVDVDMLSPRSQKTLDDATVLIRRSSWIHTFFLVIADILAPTSSPYSISTLGYVPGSILYFGFGMIAIYGGILLWELFMELNCPERPIRTYGDLAARITEHWGPTVSQYMKLTLAGLQSLELLLAIAAQILGNATGLQEIIEGANPSTVNTCFLLYSMTFFLLGGILSQIKLLNNISKFAFTNLFMLIILVVLTTVIAAEYPVLSGINNSGPPGGLYSLGYVTPGEPVSSVVATPYPFIISVSGLMNLSYAYAGSLMFVEMMSEMHTPKHFLRASILAQCIIACVYMSYGLLMYAFQGQYVANPSQQGISPYGYQTFGNVLGIVTSVISCTIYANVGIRVIYVCFLEEHWKIAPNMHTTKGTIIWGVLAVLYWFIAWILCEAIPQFSTLSAITSALTVIPFTYVFPFQLAILARFNKYNTYKEGFMNHWIRNTFDTIVWIGGIALMVLGMYSSVVVMIQAVQSGGVVIFSCAL